MGSFWVSFKRVGGALLAVPVVMLAIVAAFWVWSGTDNSLPALVQLAQTYLPAGQTLQTRDIQGSVRSGGRVGWLRWTHGELAVEAEDITLAWALQPLINKQLRLSKLTVANLRIDDQRPADKHNPPTPPADLRLPIGVDVPFEVARLTWTGSTTVHATELAGHYIFDSYSHKLINGLGRISSGKYNFDAQLQTTTPMALDVQVNGVVATQVPSSQTPLTVTAHARLSGELAEPQSVLTLQASLTPQLGIGPIPKKVKSDAMQAHLSAQILPWQAQPLHSANARWQALNLAALWPQAPLTQLAGQSSVAPKGDAWRGNISLSNTLPGPWNQQRLPLDSLSADVEFNHGQWVLQSVRASGAGGSVNGSGQFDAGQWLGSAQVRSLNPAAIDTRLAKSALSGQLQARQTSGGIGFSGQLAADPSALIAANASKVANNLQALRLQGVQAQGTWAAPELTLNQLQVTAQDAQIQGQLVVNTQSLATQGHLSWALPGMQGTLDGQLASHSGEGHLTFGVANAALATGWLAHLPIASDALAGIHLRGSADLKAHWKGGWQTGGQALQIDASLRAPQIDWRSSPFSPTQTQAEAVLREVQADLSGNLSALVFNTRAQAQIGTRQLNWHAKATGARLLADQWRANLTEFQLQAQDSEQPGLWSLASGGPGSQPIAFNWLQNRLSQTLTVSGNTAQLTGPLPGMAKLSWQPARWSKPVVQTAGSSPSKANWQTRGSVSNLPLAWLDTLSGKSMADLGLSSDMVLAGSWDASQSDTLHLSAALERSTGDLRLSADTRRQLVLPANMREAWLQVNLDGQQLSGSLRWDSDRAGKALLALSTQLQSTEKGWHLAENAPLGGSLQAQMPPVDAWSLLAPPGWRLRGTLDANATLTGTLDQPHWTGTLQAKDLAVRSVADGIDFQQGTLAARLEGQQVHIDDFTLHGAGGQAGGQVTITGLAQWLPATQPGVDLAKRIHVALQANAQKLRLSTRSDRRVTVSGQLTAQLKDAMVTLRGKLAADQALLTLPSESVPVLGADVVLRPSTAKTAQDLATKRSPTDRTGAAKGPGQLLMPDVKITLELGQNFQVRGRGLETRLMGSLELQAAGHAQPTLHGTMRTVQGTYQAYGQRLDIEQGELRFVGPVNNPELDILAIRPKLTQRVGVQVNGTVLSPIVRLYAEPELPEAEKLAWLVMGRSASGSGGEAALLQQAALALLGGSGQGPTASLSRALGLDELSFKGSSGSDTTSGATVTLGKRLSNDFYMTYESGLAGTMGVFSIFYDLSKKLTLRAKTGEQTAVDLIWTHRYD
jgi:translocation and assembly module TamB